MLKCSQILCKVNNISSLVRDYEKLGFSIEWGSAPERANNAFLWFKEGPVIEFFQMPKLFGILSLPFGLVNGRAAGKRWAHWARSPEGWCDVALEPEDIKNETTQGSEIENITDLTTIKQAIDQKGVSTSRIISGKRILPDGLKVKYSFFSPEPIGLPFVVSAYDPPQRPEKIEHPNGASGVECLKMEVAESQLHKFQILSKGDKWLKVKSSSQTRLLEVRLSGLRSRLDSKYLHGAVFTRSEKISN